MTYDENANYIRWKITKQKTEHGIMYYAYLLYLNKMTEGDYVRWKIIT